MIYNSLNPQNESNPIKLEDLFLSELDNFSEFPQSLKLSLSEFIEKFYGRFYKPILRCSLTLSK